MFAKTFSALTLVAGLTLSSLGFAATTAPAPVVAAKPAASQVVKVARVRRLSPQAKAMNKPQAPKSVKAQPRTPSKVSSKVVRTAKPHRARAAVKTPAQK
jgi:hypothetical protein